MTTEAKAVFAAMTFTHHAGCTSDYPEKVEGEAPRSLTKMDIGNGDVVWQCVDCGAFVIVDEG